MGPKRGTWGAQGATMWHQVINIHILASHSVAIGKITCHPEEPLWLLIMSEKPAKKPQMQYFQH